MTTVIVKFKYPKKLSREQAKDWMAEAAKSFVGMDGLNSKQFTFDEENQTCMTIYNWQNIEKAQALFNEGFIPTFEKRVGSRPTFEIFDCLVMVDNRANDTVVWQ